jgi:hypothetical protein
MNINNKKSFPIGLVHSLGGCGGTLLAQCLGVLQNVVLLSECNPLSARLFDYNLNPYVQLKKWYPDIFNKVKDQYNVDDLQDIIHFRDFIATVKTFLDEKNHYLIIRDYNYIDYFGVPFLTKPSLCSNLLKSIKDVFNMKQALLVRHPLDQYNSLRSHGILKDVLSPQIFLEGYHAFLSDFAGCKIIKYEDMVSHPSESISYLSGFLEAPFSKDFMTKFHTNQSVTGNFKRVGETTISLSTQKTETDSWSKILQNEPKFQILLNKLAY